MMLNFVTHNVLTTPLFKLKNTIFYNIFQAQIVNLLLKVYFAKLLDLCDK